MEATIIHEITAWAGPLAAALTLWVIKGQKQSRENITESLGLLRDKSKEVNFKLERLEERYHELEDQVVTMHAENKQLIRELHEKIDSRPRR
jgi:chromosome segregation ATPase